MLLFGPWSWNDYFLTYIVTSKHFAKTMNLTPCLQVIDGIVGFD